MRASITTTLRAVGSLALVLAGPVMAQTYDVIDMHGHALPIDYYGPTPQRMCLPPTTVPVLDVAAPTGSNYREVLNAPCPISAQSPTTEDDLRERTLSELRRLNILSLMSGPSETLEAWQTAAPDHVLFAQSPDMSSRGRVVTVDELRALHAAGKLTAIAEVAFQYDGYTPDDPRLEPYYALAEELDVPIGVHVGPGPPGIATFGAPAMRAWHPLDFQEVLARHPKLRLWLMHAGWPFADETIALMYQFPQVYVDVGVIDQLLPRAGFYDFLKRLVDAGMINHIMYGSDNMLWPEWIESSIEAIRDAPFLTEDQKRAILHDNAVRFLRLEQAPPQ